MSQECTRGTVELQTHPALRATDCSAWGPEIHSCSHHQLLQGSLVEVKVCIRLLDICLVALLKVLWQDDVSVLPHCIHASLLADGRDLCIADLVRSRHIVFQVDFFSQVHAGCASLQAKGPLSGFLERNIRLPILLCNAMQSCIALRMATLHSCKQHTEPCQTWETNESCCPHTFCREPGPAMANYHKQHVKFGRECRSFRQSAGALQRSDCIQADALYNVHCAEKQTWNTRRFCRRSGNGNSILRSSRPGRSRAGSSVSALLVAMMTLTLTVWSNPSIWFRSSMRIRCTSLHHARTETLN